MNKEKIKAWCVEWLILSAAVIFATWALEGITCNSVLTMMLVAATISFLNSFLRPLLLLISMPLIIATAGIGMVFILWVINSIILYFASWFFTSFNINSFGTAMFGALFISIAQLALNIIFGVKPRNPIASTFGGNQPPPPSRGQKETRQNANDDVIDI